VCTQQVGPELEVCGYGCEDHFSELDTVQHCWEALAVRVVTPAAELVLLQAGVPA
jgi:NAD+ synthase (glutamine-hydrolysing)